MKKMLIGILAILSITSLVACENKNKVETVPENEVSINESSEENTNEVIDETQESNEVAELTDEEKYQDLINNYKSAMSEFDLDDLDIEEKIGNKYDMLNLSLLAHVARYKSEGVKLTYGFYDIDKNGTNELLVGADDSLGAIYSFDLSSNKPTKIFFQDTLERGNLDIYDNGVILSGGSGGAALHYYEFGKISGDGMTYELLEAIEEEYVDGSETPVYRNSESREELEYKTLDEIMDKYVPNSNAIKNIDYSEI